MAGLSIHSRRSQSSTTIIFPYTITVIIGLTNDALDSHVPMLIYKNSNNRHRIPGLLMAGDKPRSLFYSMIIYFWGFILSVRDVYPAACGGAGRQGGRGREEGEGRRKEEEEGDGGGKNGACLCCCW